MTSKKNKFITTTLPYANGKGHIGHAFEFILADALVRYFKFNGYDAFFNLGLDEHGLKIQQTAEKLGISPKEYVDSLAVDWKEFLKKLDVNSWDSFYRTSDAEHIVKVQQFWVESFNRGDIYKKHYKGVYCVGCESFKSERELVDERCPDHPETELKEVEEENYFFRLTKHKLALQTWANHSVDFIEPASKRTEFLNFIDNIQDISVSRLKKDVYWGTPVPGDDEHTVYVWFCALLNYLFAAGLYKDDEIFENSWNNADVIQICGPDNLKFQAVIFQGLLASASIKKTNKLLVHGTILDSDGRKMSKTLGNVVDPIEQVDKYGVDAVRYYALAGLRTYGNSSWDEKQLVDLYNSHLADDYGNLVARVTHLAGKILEELKDDPTIKLDYSCIDNAKYAVGVVQVVASIKALWEEFKISEALDETNKFVKTLNKKIGDEKPWEDSKKGWARILELHHAISLVNELYYPVIPGKVGEVKKALNECKKAIVFPKIELR